MLPFLTILMIFCILFVTKRREGLFFLALPLFNVGYFAISTEIFEFGKILPFNLYSSAQRDAYIYVQWMYILHFLAVYLAFQSVDRLKPARVYRQPGEVDWRQRLRSRKLGFPYFLICISPILFVLLSLDFSLLIDRGVFSHAALKQFWMRFADLLFLVSAVLTPFLRSPAQRLITVSLIVFFFIMLGSRSAPVMLIIYVAVERFIINKKRPVVHAGLILLAFYILAVLLAMRVENQGGLISFIRRVGDISFRELIYYATFGANYILNFSIVINARLLLSVTAQADWFYYAVLPLPSFVYDLTLRYDDFNRFTVSMPYPGFGYAVQFLGPAVYLASVFIGFMLIGILRNTIVTHRDIGERILLGGLCMLPFIISLQYNLRTSSRIFYMFVLLYFAAGFVRRLRWRSSVAARA